MGQSEATDLMVTFTRAEAEALWESSVEPRSIVASMKVEDRERYIRSPYFEALYKIEKALR